MPVAGPAALPGLDCPPLFDPPARPAPFLAIDALVNYRGVPVSSKRRGAFYPGSTLSFARVCSIALPCWSVVSGPFPSLRVRLLACRACSAAAASRALAPASSAPLPAASAAWAPAIRACLVLFSLALMRARILASFSFCCRSSSIAAARGLRSAYLLTKELDSMGVCWKSCNVCCFSSTFFLKPCLNYCDICCDNWPCNCPRPGEAAARSAPFEATPAVVPFASWPAPGTRMPRN